jgi:hypothetical protein
MSVSRLSHDERSCERRNGANDVNREQPDQGRNDASKFLISLREVAWAIQLIEKKTRGWCIARVAEHVGIGCFEAALLEALHFRDLRSQRRLVTSQPALCADLLKTLQDQVALLGHLLMVGHCRTLSRLPLQSGRPMMQHC